MNINYSFKNAEDNNRSLANTGGFFVDSGNSRPIFSRAFIEQSARITSGYLLNKIACIRHRVAP